MAKLSPIDDVSGTAIAAYMLPQLSFWTLVQNGLLPKSEAEQMLRTAIEANLRTGKLANRSAAAKLQGVLELISADAKQPTFQ
jgi:hypothetical protein